MQTNKAKLACVQESIRFQRWLAKRRRQEAVQSDVRLAQRLEAEAATLTLRADEATWVLKKLFGELIDLESAL